MPPALPTFTPYREDLEPWRGEGLVRLRVLAVPSPGRTGAVREALDAFLGRVRINICTNTHRSIIPVKYRRRLTTTIRSMTEEVARQRGTG